WDAREQFVKVGISFIAGDCETGHRNIILSKIQIQSTFVVIFRISRVSVRTVLQTGIVCSLMLICILVAHGRARRLSPPVLAFVARFGTGARVLSAMSGRCRLWAGGASRSAAGRHLRTLQRRRHEGRAASARLASVHDLGVHRRLVVY
ncbi:unnamed protein product, partial [Mycena citricolor]